MAQIVPLYGLTKNISHPETEKARRNSGTCFESESPLQPGEDIVDIL
ncbi:MAG: hypothetical protein H6Q21_1223 [Bacteroidetes bacterium]|nr:hypothetical protein [Bacteroidota bacterium]